MVRGRGRRLELDPGPLSPAGTSCRGDAGKEGSWREEGWVGGLREGWGTGESQSPLVSSAPQSPGHTTTPVSVKTSLTQPED